MKVWIYDEETYLNIFCVGFKCGDEKRVFEISWRVNQLDELLAFIGQMKINGDRMVGFNNQGFDYPVMHYIIENQDHCSVIDIYNKAMSIINADWNNRFQHVIWDDQCHIPQVDLYKIHHFDNVSRATSLKVLEFNMRLDFIEDLPFPPGTILNWDECDELISYMWNDIHATERFYFESTKQIEFRETLTEKYGRNFINHNDTKIGKDYFIMELERLVQGFNKKQQTPRESIRVDGIIFPYVTFIEPEFQRILNWFRAQTITDTKGAFKDVNCTINGFQFDFGTGGIHGSVDSCVVESDDEFMIDSIDVKSYYPNLAIANRLYPEHLGEQFCDIYQDVYTQRTTHAKGTIGNAMLKLALNGVYGDSNNKYSCFYDPQYTMSITINGQLLLCMLAEQLMKVPDLQMILINTDGLECRYKRIYEEHVKEVCTWWEKLTGLELESYSYVKLCVRDVNNYIGVFEE